MNRFILSCEAGGDVAEIWDYIAADNIDAADRIVETLQAAFQRLSESPLIGHVRPEVTDESIRFWKVKSYLVIYRPGDSPLSIVRILHGARDISAILDK